MIGKYHKMKPRAWTAKDVDLLNYRGGIQQKIGMHCHKYNRIQRLCVTEYNCRFQCARAFCRILQGIFGPRIYNKRANRASSRMGTVEKQKRLPVEAKITKNVSACNQSTWENRIKNCNPFLRIPRCIFIITVRCHMMIAGVLSDWNWPLFIDTGNRIP